MIHYTIIGPSGTSLLCARNWPSERKRLWDMAQRADEAHDKQMQARRARLFNEEEPCERIRYILH